MQELSLRDRFIKRVQNEQKLAKNCRSVGLEKEAVQHEVKIESLKSIYKRITKKDLDI